MAWVAGPGLILEARSTAGQAFVITDEHDRALCTVVLGERDAVADLTGTCPSPQAK